MQYGNSLSCLCESYRAKSIFLTTSLALRVNSWQRRDTCGFDSTRFYGTIIVCTCCKHLFRIWVLCYQWYSCTAQEILVWDEVSMSFLGVMYTILIRYTLASITAPYHFVIRTLMSISSVPTYRLYKR